MLAIVAEESIGDVRASVNGEMSHRLVAYMLDAQNLNVTGGLANY
ncbi:MULTISPECIES: hypothetical protein [unclassified Streptomyces]